MAPARPGPRPDPHLVLSSETASAPGADRLIPAVKAAGGAKVLGFHVATDHGWSDQRLTLQALVINWLAGL